MYITDFALNDFRSYSEVVLKFDPAVVVLVGENGQGKTNLVEAIAYLATFSSHRVAADAALVRQGATAGVIRAKVVNGESETMLELEILAGRANRARINRGNVRPAELLGIVKAVVFAPEDLELVKGDPSARRRMLDELLIQLRPRYSAIRNEYEKVLRQRAALLKTAAKIRRRGGIFEERTLDIWDKQLAKLGAQIIAARAKNITRLRPFVREYYHQVSGGRGIARIDYECNLDVRLGEELPSAAQLISDSDVWEEKVTEWEKHRTDVVENEKDMLRALQENRQKEIERGVNLVGPHRDDMRLSLGSLPAKGYASHGESWSFALALRLGEWQLLRTDESGDWAHDEEPILILDDVFSELDGQRRSRLAQIVKDGQQVFVTAAVAEDLPEELTGMKLWVANGKVTPWQS
ncbi:MAG: DNA replication/repair protein RecF [Trueperella sp.]|nr:DNA replication/repair protein RecF [Trueperella sp.]